MTDAEINKRIAEIELLRKALMEIRKGQGAYNIDPLQHAENCISRACDIADAALNGRTWEDE